MTGGECRPQHGAELNYLPRSAHSQAATIRVTILNAWQEKEQQQKMKQMENNNRHPYPNNVPLLRPPRCPLPASPLPLPKYRKYGNVSKYARGSMSPLRVHMTSVSVQFLQIRIVFQVSIFVSHISNRSRRGKCANVSLCVLRT